MKYIAHRGNINGLSENENNPEYITQTLNLGYDVEIDVWYNNGYFLGHDEPLYEVDRKFFIDSRIWCHAKDDQTCIQLELLGAQVFKQTNERIVPVKNTFVSWAHQLAGPIKNAIYTHLEYEKYLPDDVYGICTDYVSKYTKGLPFRVLLLDVDGVLTDGTKLYDKDHKKLAKFFCDRDFTAIKRFKAAGIKVLLLTGDEWNVGMAKSRNLDYKIVEPINGVLDKSLIINELAKKYKLPYSQFVFVGDDYYDLSACNLVKSYCPADASLSLNAARLKTNGGKGAIDELYSLYDLPDNYPFDYL